MYDQILFLITWQLHQTVDARRMIMSPFILHFTRTKKKSYKQKAVAFNTLHFSNSQIVTAPRCRKKNPSSLLKTHNEIVNVQRSNKSILKSTDATQSNYDRPFKLSQTIFSVRLHVWLNFFSFFSLSDTFVFFISFICSHFFIIHGCRWIISFYLEVIRFVFSCKTDNFRCVYAGAIKMNKQLTLNVSHAINCFHFFFSWKIQQ